MLRTCVLFFVFCAVCWCDVAAQSPSIPLSEWHILEELYNSTNGNNWNWYNDTASGAKWNFSVLVNPCTQSWQGINCTFVDPFEYYHISSINLDRFHMNGSIPDSIGGLQQLEVLSLYANRIRGTIPENICNLSNLSVLELYSNLLRSSLPACMGNLTLLKRVDLSLNLLHGELPSSFANLANLEALDLSVNRLNGTIPAGIGYLNQLRTIYWNANKFSGTIPATFRHLSSLIQINLADNLLIGTLPAYFGELPSLALIRLERNDFRGQLPSSWGHLPVLAVLDVSHNDLSGTIPASFANLNLLADIDLADNSFNGTLPDFLWSLPILATVHIDNTLVSGTISPAIGNARRLRVLHLQDNRLHGPIPPELGTLPKLDTLVLSGNTLSGTIPESFGNLSTLLWADISYNLLQGTLPASVGGLSSLKFLYVEYNLLTGTLPPELGQARNLSQFSANNNALRGTIPTSLSALVDLNLLILSYNKLTGPIDQIVDPTVQKTLNSIQIANNMLTGTIPENIFKIDRLSGFVAGSNCFRGSLPQEVCGATYLTSLSLDGLSSAKSCRIELIPGFHSYERLGRFSTTLPECYLKMLSLKTLHLSGIGLQGTLPNVDIISPHLADLALAHNALTGTIPLNMQTKVYESLDLSYNRLSGTLSPAFANATAKYSLFLINNRLSGEIPPTVKNLRDLSILGSNVFSCNAKRSDLPEHNDHVDKYECASQSFDMFFYAWLALIFFSSCAFFAVLYHFEVTPRDVLETEFGKKLVAWTRAASGEMFFAAFADRLETVALVSRICDLLCLAAVYCLAFILLIALPLYVAMGHYYGTLTHRYAYTVSMAFLSGVPPAVVEMLVLLGLLSIVVYLLLRYLFKLSRKETEIRSNARSSRRMDADSIVLLPPSRLAWLRNSTLYVLFVTVNLFIVIGANSAYIYVVLNASGWSLVTAQILIGCFKIVWNGAGSTMLVRLVKQNLIETDNTAKQRSARETRLIMLQIFVALINNIAVPCAVTAVVSPSCFYYVFIPARVIKTPFRYTVCSVFAAGSCVDSSEVPIVTEYQPSFDYSYQCSSSIVQYYAPAFVSVCVITTFVTPAGQLLLHYWHQRATPGTMWHRCLDRILPNILKPIPEVVVDVRDKTYRGFFQANHLLILLTNFLGLLLTFGAVFPPLAVALTLTLLCVTTFVKLKVGRFLTNAVSKNRLEFIDLIEAECQRAGAVEVLRRSAWLMLGFCCAFFTIFVFDTLGDSVGFDRAYWVLIVLPLLPFVLMGVMVGTRRASQWWRGDSAKTKKERIVSARVLGDIEMKSSASMSSRDSSNRDSRASSNASSMNVSMSDIYDEPTMNVLVLSAKSANV